MKLNGTYIVLSCCLSHFSCATTDPQALALEKIEAFRQRGKTITVRYLDPSAPAGPGMRPADEFVIVSEASVSNSNDKQRLWDALVLAIRKAPDVGYECWDPRHATVVPGAQEAKVTICFSCHQGMIREGDDTSGFLVDGQASEAFDRVFRMYGLKKAAEKKSKPNQLLRATKQGKSEESGGR